MTSKSIRISDALQDSLNLNMGTEAGAALLDTSLEEVGYARSMVMSADGVIICGNQTHKAAMRRGDGDLEPIIVETEGDRPVIVKRKDVKSGTAKAMKIAAFDNLANQRGLQWTPEIRVKAEAVGLTVDELAFTPVELTEIESAPASAPSESSPPVMTSSISVVAECRDEEQAQELFARLQGEGFRCRVLTI